MSARVFGRYDAPTILRMFEEEGLLEALERKSFSAPEVSVSAEDSTAPFIRLRAAKGGRTHLLFEGRLTEVIVTREHTLLARDASVALILWAREQDPTQWFSGDHPQLPLQAHPGLGLLKRMFRVGVRMMREAGKDGVANLPKYPHDALIFLRSLGFSFLQPVEQGRLEALWRDLGRLGLRDLTLAVVGQAVVDENGATVVWSPGFQLHPLSPLLVDYFQSPVYTRARDEACSKARFTVRPRELEAAVSTFEDWRRRSAEPVV